MQTAGADGILAVRWQGGCRQRAQTAFWQSADRAETDSGRRRHSGSQMTGRMQTAGADGILAVRWQGRNRQRAQTAFWQSDDRAETDSGHRQHSDSQMTGQKQTAGADSILAMDDRVDGDIRHRHLLIWNEKYKNLNKVFVGYFEALRCFSIFHWYLLNGSD